MCIYIYINALSKIQNVLKMHRVLYSKKSTVNIGIMVYHGDVTKYMEFNPPRRLYTMFK